MPKVLQPGGPAHPLPSSAGAQEKGPTAARGAGRKGSAHVRGFTQHLQSGSLDRNVYFFHLRVCNFCIDGFGRPSL